MKTKTVALSLQLHENCKQFGTILLINTTVTRTSFSAYL